MHRYEVLPINIHFQCPFGAAQCCYCSEQNENQPTIGHIFNEIVLGSGEEEAMGAVFIGEMHSM